MAFLLSNLVAADAPKAPPSSPARSLTYAPAPPDNPLKGFVPYLRADTTFPHSLEWDYTKLSDVMTGPTNFHRAPFEAKLNAAASRGHQFVARFHYDWPIELAALNAQDKIAASWTTDWRLTGVLPGEPARVWRSHVPTEALPAGDHRLLLRVPNARRW